MKKSIILVFSTLSILVQAQVNQINLIFTPLAGGNPIQVAAMDTGSGFTSDQQITLLESSEYELSVDLGNAQAQLESRSAEIQFYVLTAPDFLQGSIEYQDSDVNQLPVGFLSELTTTCVESDSEGEFTLLLIDFGPDKASGVTPEQGDTLFHTGWSLEILKDADAPPCENEEEIITDVILTWTPEGGGDPVIARAQDPDGEGPLDLVILDEIQLLESTEYTLSITLSNEIAGEDITEEISSEADEHMFFFAFSDEVMQSPSGDGNIDNRQDPINYLDFDENELPLGLSTRWVTACTDETISGMFQLILKHQPDIKTTTSGINDGSTDLDLIFSITLVDQQDAPPCENEEEIITDVVLTWISETDTVVARAQDPDGEGPLDLEILDDIELRENTLYRLELSLSNELEGEDITDEIREEDDEHMFFFAFSEGIFSDPSGDGNVDNRGDTIRYRDFDENNLPVGLTTAWQTAASMNAGTFQIILKHQPQIKSATSTVHNGNTDVDLTFNIRSIATSLNDVPISSDDLLISPNPVSDIMNWNIIGSRIHDIKSISIFNMQGILVLESDAQEPWIDAGKLASGGYILKVQSKKQIWIKKFIKN